MGPLTMAMLVSAVPRCADTVLQLVGMAGSYVPYFCQTVSESL